MTHGSLFSGIGGFDLASQWCEWENIFQVEIDEFCQKVLTKNFPDVKRYKDIKEFDGTEYKESIDIISGGFPCQPFSVAGKRKGTEDDRSLWHEMYRVIKEIKPNWIVGENVTGIINMELDNMLSDLETEGYKTQTFVIPACAVNTPHRRDRIWIIANSASNGYVASEKQRSIRETNDNSKKRKKENSNVERCGSLWLNVSNPTIKRLEGEKSESEFSGGQSGRFTKCNWWTVEPAVGRVANGIPNRVDRLKSLGNAIVPQVAYEIFKIIDKLNN